MIQEKPNNNLELEKSTSRRSRKDEEGRDYQCGCGKRYLSYPALYTHIKTKHDGRQPEGTQKTGTSMMTKRIKGKTEDEILKSLTSYLQRGDLKLLGELDDNHLGSVSVHARFRKDLMPREIVQCYQALLKQSEVHVSKNSSLDMLLVIFLFNVGEYVQEKLYDHYVLFARLLRGCYIQYGSQVFRSCFAKKEGQAFDGSKVRYVPIICDCLLRYYIPYSDHSKDYRDVNLSLMELILSDFCGWLFKKRFSNIKVTLKKQYRLESKPVPLIKHRSSVKGDAGKEKEHKDESCSDSVKKDHEIDHEQSEEEFEEESEEEIHEELNELGQAKSITTPIASNKEEQQVPQASLNEQRQQNKQLPEAVQHSMEGVIAGQLIGVQVASEVAKESEAKE